MANLPDLTPTEAVRAARHLTLTEIGESGQRRLKAARVLVVGLGGLGSPVAQALAAAGVGTLGLVEHDRIEASNLQRQLLYTPADVGRPKLDAATERLQSINPDTRIEPHAVRLTAEHAAGIVSRYDLVVDGSDNFATRFAVNAAAVQSGKAVVSGAVQRFEGQVSVFAAPGGPCYRCLVPTMPPPESAPGCVEVGVLATLPGLVGQIQATEAIKWIVGIGRPLVGRVLLIDGLELSFRTMRLARDPACPVCGNLPSPDPTVPMSDPTMHPDEITVEDLKAKLDAGETFRLIDVREPNEVAMSQIPGSEHIAMNSVPQRLDELGKDDEIVLHCRSGSRSMRVLNFLRSQGYTNVKNLQGGIHAWSDRIDPSVPKV